MRKRDPLEGRRLTLVKAFQPTSADNSRAWAAIQPMLLAAGDKGVRYEQLNQAAKLASRSGGNGLVGHLVNKGVLKLAPDKGRLN